MQAAYPRPKLRRRNPTRALASVLASLTLLGTLIASGPASSQGLRVAGSFPRFVPVEVLYTDPVHRLLYVVTSDAITIRHLDTLAVLRTVAKPQEGVQASFAVDRRLAVVDAQGGRLFLPYRLHPNQTIQLGIVDGTSGTLTSYPLPPPAAPVPSEGFTVEGMDYRAAGDELYLLRWVPGSDLLFMQALVATTGETLWTRQVMGCSTLLSVASGQSQMPAPFGRSGDAMFLACKSEGPAAIVKIPLEDGQPGTEKGFLAPANARSGIFDDESGRLVLLSAGLLVFDGEHEAWIGAAPESAVGAFGTDPSRGRFYGCGSEGVLLADMLVATPAPPGEVHPALTCPPNTMQGYVAVDPVKRRFFVPREDGAAWLAVEDESEPFQAPQGFDPDEGTVDQEEAEGVTDSSAGAQSGAYGAHIVLTGGPMGLLDNPNRSLSPTTRESSDIYGIRPAEGARDIHLARVVHVKGAREALEGKAISADRDPRTDGDFEQLRRWNGDLRPTKGQPSSGERLTALTCESAPIPGEPACADYSRLRDILKERTCSEDLPAAVRDDACLDTSELPTWGYDYSECSAFGGELDVPKVEQEGSSATCDLQKASVQAHAETDLGQTLAQLGERSTNKKDFFRQLADTLADLRGTLTIGDSMADSTVRLDPELGIVADTHAETRNLVLGLQGLGKMTIEEVILRVRAQARGRSGKAKTTWERTVKGVKISSPNGDFECEEDCSLEEIASAVEEAFLGRVHVVAPQPEGQFLNGSEKGTTAMFREDLWRQLEQEILGDKFVEDLTMPALEIRVQGNVDANSGLTLQLAGATATSIYRIFKIPEIAPPPPFDPGVPPSEVLIPPEIGEIGGDNVLGGEPSTTTILERIKQGVRLVLGWGNDFPRLLAGWALLLAPFYVATRRRAFIRAGRRGA